ncbi:MAG: hypothetical protein WA814_08205 [Candidatus Baltobacteraceae bacterium]
MQRRLLLSVCVLACVGLLPLAARPDVTAGTPAGTPPPQIYHVVTTALCSRLHERVRPAIAMVLQNDQSIGKSPPLFQRYERGTITAIQAQQANGTGPPQNGDSIYNQSPETDMALQQMSYLVSPIARNLISAQTLLDDEKMLAPTGSPSDDAALQQIKSQLLAIIAFQSASLDLINGFVATQQMGELQHVGQEYLGAISSSEMTSHAVQPTPNPWQDPNTPGLTQNPYNFDVTTVPGLAVGYNPLNSIMDGMAWLQAETGKREDAASRTISAALSACRK